MAKENKVEKSLNNKELNISNSGRGIWLVKVPKYIAKAWQTAPGLSEVGKLRIVKAQGKKAEISLTLADSVANFDGKSEIPKQHKLNASLVNQQTLGVYSQANLESGKAGDEAMSVSNNLCMEGRIVQKLECTPVADQAYMKLKLESIKKASIPDKQAVRLDKIVRNFKPVSDHKHNVSYNYYIF